MGKGAFSLCLSWGAPGPFYFEKLLLDSSPSPPHTTAALPLGIGTTIAGAATGLVQMDDLADRAPQFGALLIS